jgi:putative ABC transport system permease protein
LIQGNSSDALREPNTAVITEDMAQKYFGNSNPLGKTFILNSAETKITGIAQDIPPNSHFRFDFLVSFSTLGHPSFRNFVYDMLTDWRSHNFYTYLLLRDENSYLGLQKKFIPFLEKHFNTKISNSGLYLQPLKDIHLHSKNFS